MSMCNSKSNRMLTAVHLTDTAVIDNKGCLMVTQGAFKKLSSAAIHDPQRMISCTDFGDPLTLYL